VERRGDGGSRPRIKLKELPQRIGVGVAASGACELLYQDATWSLTRFPGQWLCGIDCVVATGGIASRGVDVVSDLYYFAAHVADLPY
jgi:hypothetical protein